MCPSCYLFTASKPTLPALSSAKVSQNKGEELQQIRWAAHSQVQGPGQESSKHPEKQPIGRGQCVRMLRRAIQQLGSLLESKRSEYANKSFVCTQILKFSPNGLPAGGCRHSFRPAALKMRHNTSLHITCPQHDGLMALRACSIVCCCFCATVDVL